MAHDKQRMELSYGSSVPGAKHRESAPCFPHELALNEANKCLLCKNPQCQKGCPIHTDIPGVIRLFKEGKTDEAGRKLFMNNPLTTVCCIVCDHAAQCEGHCVQKKDPVHFSVIESYLSSTYALQMNAGPAPSNGLKTAIIGAGPSGLTIAVILARYGYDVTIFENQQDIGGIMRYAIPDYRLPNAVLDDFRYRHIDLKNIKVRANTYIGTSITIDDLLRDGFASVFVGAGLWKSRPLGIPGETLPHVTYSLEYLKNPEIFPVGKRCAIIGVGNSAMDCARTAVRYDAEEVTCFARRGGITASAEETTCAKNEGVQFCFRCAPVEIREDGIVFRRTEKLEDGTFRQIEGSEVFYPCDSVIISAGQASRSSLLDGVPDIATHRGLIATDASGQTSRPGVFSAGDAVAGARTVVEAVASAKLVAEAMHEYMQGLPRQTLTAPCWPELDAATGETVDHVYEKVCETVQECFVVEGTLSPASSIEREIKARQLDDYVRFVERLQQVFSICLSEDDLRWEHMDTVAKITDIVKTHLFNIT